MNKWPPHTHGPHTLRAPGDARDDAELPLSLWDSLGGIYSDLSRDVFGVLTHESTIHENQVLQIHIHSLASLAQSGRASCGKFFFIPYLEVC